MSKNKFIFRHKDRVDASYNKIFGNPQSRGKYDGYDFEVSPDDDFDYDVDFSDPKLPVTLNKKKVTKKHVEVINKPKPEKITPIYEEKIDKKNIEEEICEIADSFSEKQSDFIFPEKKIKENKTENEVVLKDQPEKEIVYVEKKKKLTEEEIKRKHKKRYIKFFSSTVSLLITIAAISVLIAMLVLPVFHVYGTSMTPCLQDGEIVVCIKTTKFKEGDIVAFYYNNKVLLKRLIANPGQWVNIDSEGNVSVDGKILSEPYLTEEKALGNCDIELPYQVPDAKYFVLGDHRETSLDSRNSAIGTISEEQMIGKLLIRVWPLNKIKIIN